jgi:glycine/D-amino acid oxidase-like deaminating enzyme
MASRTESVERDLRSGTPLWLSPAPRELPRDEWPQNFSADVLVIGAGISGALVAESLTEAGRSVAIVDRRGPIKGSTPASTALLQYETDTPLSELSDLIGVDDAERAWRRSRLSVLALSERTRRLGIDAKMIQRDSLYLAGDRLDPKGLAREEKARRQAGFEGELLTRNSLKNRFGFSRAGALLSFNDMTADPVLLARGYLRVALERGAKLLAPVQIDGLEIRKRDVVAQTKSGQRIRAREVVFATGYEMPARFKLKGHRIISTYALATVPQTKTWPEECVIWEASDPYLYLRTTPDHRIIVGGEDEEFADEDARDALLKKKTATILRKLKKLLPQVRAEAEFAWTGSFGVSATGLPSIGPLPGMPRCFAVLGYGGNGITFSMIAAQILRAAITGTADRDADLFAFR